VASSNNLFGDGCLVGLDCNVAGEYQQPARAKALLKQAMQWREGRSLYPVHCLMALMELKKNTFHPLCSGLGEWHQFWGQPASGSVTGAARFAAADLRTRLRGKVQTLTPADFRLAKGSPGQGAGPGGKDLGADVDLVGPGEAYHRWRQSPAYRGWRNKTNELMGVPSPP
jgi:hypothetical protein